MKRLLEHNEFSGLTQYFHYDELADTFTIETVGNAEPVIERNKKLYNEGRRRGGWNFIASIPPEVILTWRSKYGLKIEDRNHWPRIKRLLNDSEWRYLRTAPGMI